MFSYGVRCGWHGSVRKGGSISIITEHLTEISRCGYRPNVTFAKSLILKFDYAIETRRSNRNVASAGLITRVNLVTETRTRATMTDLQGFLHPLERAINGRAKRSPTLLREMFEPCTREPFRNVLDFGVDH
jgi:hypothetical protein